jgi:ATP-dependent RNA helicase DDX5/DBP2
VLKEFRSGRSPILIATDVAARGLDVKDIRHVINFDFPNQIEDYVHRIGRTGRAGAKGAAYTFFTEDKARMASDLLGILREANQAIPAELERMARSGGGAYGGGRGKGGGKGGKRRW